VRILLVEDEPTVAEAVRSALADEGYAVDCAVDANTALEFADVYPYDLVILDLVLPGASGLTVAARLRAGRGENTNVPILMLTALGTIDDRVAGLDSGADDYLVKPFAMAELLARVRALRRRDTTSPPLVRVADLELDPARKRVTRGGRDIPLTAREFALLEVLAHDPGRIYSQDRLIDAIWDAEFEASSNVVEVYIRSLRRKLDGGRRDGLIRTVRGAGYCLDVPPGSVS
jgi:two-component system, OmpR family, copper resistance phosphate regulon response regulator CusR